MSDTKRTSLNMFQPKQLRYTSCCSQLQGRRGNKSLLVTISFTFFYENRYQKNLHLISILMIPNLAIFRQYFLDNYQFSPCLSTIEGTCLTRPEAASFPFESTMSYISARATNPFNSSSARHSVSPHSGRM